MAFMQPDIQFGDWIEVDGNAGTDYIPPGFVSLPDYAEFAASYDGDDVDGAYRDAAFAAVADYTENRECYSISERKGYGVRLSAPGYMDCTDWSVFDTEAECRDHLVEFWEVCPDCGEDECDCG